MSGDTRQYKDRQLRRTMWGVFLIIVGSAWLIPGDQLPSEAWIFALGVLMIGMNVYRFSQGLRVTAVTAVIGVLAILAGIGGLFGLDIPIFPIVLILVALHIIFDNQRGSS